MRALAPLAAAPSSSHAARFPAEDMPENCKATGRRTTKKIAVYDVMRIVGGSHGGRVLRAPAGASTRPTSEKVREALFNILGSVEGDHVLDLFAGSGGVGIEALSRGAAHATFVDSGRSALAIVRQNLTELGLLARGRCCGSGCRHCPYDGGAGDAGTSSPARR